MAFVSLRQVLDHAAEHGYGVPAFNVKHLGLRHGGAGVDVCAVRGFRPAS